MKYLMLLLFTFAAHTAAQADDNYHMTMRLSHAFMISQEDARKCIQKMAVTPGELWILNETSLDDMDSNNKTLRKAICTLTCCAQAQGTMIGAELQLPVIHKLVQVAAMPQYVKPTFHKFVDECAEMVKNLTDECDVGFEFVKCISDKPWENIDKES